MKKTKEEDEEEEEEENDEKNNGVNIFRDKLIFNKIFINISTQFVFFDTNTNILLECIDFCRAICAKTNYIN